ncbi:hypothetical protein BDD12DRAFT_855919 [Trichophaea hybrida]|nr:hypothetical protein BDD12DRAFT_855919 [Trichophaea hybrida]
MRLQALFMATNGKKERFLKHIRKQSYNLNNNRFLHLKPHRNSTVLMKPRMITSLTRRNPFLRSILQQPSHQIHHPFSFRLGIFALFTSYRSLPLSSPPSSSSPTIPIRSFSVQHHRILQIFPIIPTLIETPLSFFPSFPRYFLHPPQHIIPPSKKRLKRSPYLSWVIKMPQASAHISVFVLAVKSKIASIAL